MFDYAQTAVEGALAAGAGYADARVVIATTESIDVQNQVVESMDHTETAGVGVRALVGSSWGFYATADLTDAAAREAGAMAARIAEASATVPGPPVVLADVPVVTDEYTTPHVEDPLAVPLAEKVELLVDVTHTMQAVPGVAIARGNLTFWVTDKWFVSSQGHRIKQRLVESGGGYDATALVRLGDATPLLPTVVRPVRDRGIRDRAPLGLRRQRAADRRGGRRPGRPHRPSRKARRSSSSRRRSSPCRSTSRWATPSSSTGSSAGRRPSPGRRTSSWSGSTRTGTGPR